MLYNNSLLPCSSETIFSNACMLSCSALLSAAPLAYSTAQDSLNKFSALLLRTSSKSFLDSAVSKA
jgi:hypothetical protein